MARKLPPKDVVIIGLGWTGSILGYELAKAGLDVVAIEHLAALRSLRGELLAGLLTAGLIDQCRLVFVWDPCSASRTGGSPGPPDKSVAETISNRSIEICAF